MRSDVYKFLPSGPTPKELKEKGCEVHKAHIFSICTYILTDNLGSNGTISHGILFLLEKMFDFEPFPFIPKKYSCLFLQNFRLETGLTILFEIGNSRELSLLILLLQ